MRTTERFPAFFRYLIEHKGYQASTIAEASGLHAPDVSRILTGKRPVGGKVFTKLIKAIREEDRAEALKAWLKDQCPSGSEDYVHIISADTTVVSESKKPTPYTLDGALEILRQQADHVEPLRQVLMNLAQVYDVIRT